MRGLLKSVLPAELLSLLQLEALEEVPGTFVDEALKARFTDLLYRVPLRRGGSALVYVLVEHKSHQDRWAVLQMLGYCLRIWERAKADGARKLPPIIPLLVTHAEDGWRGPVQLADLLEPEASEVPALARLTPHFEVVLDDVGRLSDEALLRREVGLFAQVVLLLLRDNSNPDVLGKLLGLVDLLRAILSTPGGERRFTMLLSYLGYLRNDEPSVDAQRIIDALPESKEVVLNWIEQLETRGFQKGKDEGHREGHREGRQEGRQEGRTEALRTTVQRQLERRFGALPPGALARVNAADDATLEAYADRLVTAPSLDHVLEPT
jgi:hypothetical protein